jgi:hypothetical protein
MVAAPAVALTLLDFPAGNASVDQLPPGLHMARYWLSGPDVLCNDGTAPGIYVRAGSVTNRDKWIIYLQGGGSCGSDAECLERWQHNNSAYGIQKMSTRVPQAVWNAWHPAAPGPAGWTLQGADYQIPPSIAGRGIFSPQPTNNFRDWNKVYAYYCSSDEWTGQKTSHDFSSAPLPYTANFRGASIFDAMISELRSGTLTYVLNGEPVTLPDLDDAAMVLLAGSSAGGNGVKHNLDKLRADLHAVNPRTQVRGVIDAAGSPSSAGLPWPPTGPAVSYEQDVTGKWAGVFQGMWNARVDASCLSENPLLVQYRCADSAHVLRHHISAPFFHRMDLQDANGIDSYTHIFYPNPPYPSGLAESRFAQDIAVQLTDIGNFATVLAPRYVNELNAISGDPQWLHPGVFGPRCTSHMGLPFQNSFFQQAVPDAAGVLHSYHDTLWQWVTQPPAGVAGPLGPVLITTPGIGSIGAPQC